MAKSDNYIEDKGLLELAKKLNNKLFEIRSSFYVWKYLASLTNTTVVGQEDTGKNLALINLHKGFFIPVIDALLCRIIIDVHQLFETRRGQETINNLLDPIQKRSYDFQKEYLTLKTEFEPEIILIEEARNKLFAHKEIKKDSFSLPSIVRLDELLRKLAEFLSKVSGQTFGHSWHIPEEKSMEAKTDTQLTISNLIRGESARIAEIETECRNFPINN